MNYALKKYETRVPSPAGIASPLYGAGFATPLILNETVLLLIASVRKCNVSVTIGPLLIALLLVAKIAQ